MDKFKDLTDKQKQFCKEYVLDWNATRAAKAAGYSEKTAQVIGSENLSKPIIKAYIEHIQEDLLKLCSESVLKNIKRLQEILDNQEAKDNDKIRSIEVISKLLGLNSPDKSEVTSKVEMTVEEKADKIKYLLKKAKE